jgi:hypothetical protein
MRKLILLIFCMSILSVNSQERDLHFRPLRLKDGTYLFINMDDRMDMMDKKGQPIAMEDGIEMELEDGTLIMMKNKKLWHYTPKDWEH